MTCKICSSPKTRIIYKGSVRDGGLGQYTQHDVIIRQCEECKVIWHDNRKDARTYYESEEYRNSLEGGSTENQFYKLHDRENFDKFRYTNTSCFRNKFVVDIGCGCGGFLDFVKGVAKQVIAIEPSKKYRAIMDKKGLQTYAYTSNIPKEYKSKVDVITSFDVIEHVENPIAFIEDVFTLLKEGGKAIIGTPTDAPVMRSLLGTLYEKKILYSTQHLWIFSESSLTEIAQRAGFEKIEFKYFQRYGLGNMLGWLKCKEPNSDINEEFITNTMDKVWKSQLEERKLSDYIVMYLEK